MTLFQKIIVLVSFVLLIGAAIYKHTGHSLHLTHADNLHVELAASVQHRHTSSSSHPITINTNQSTNTQNTVQNNDTHSEHQKTSSVTTQNTVKTTSGAPLFRAHEHGSDWLPDYAAVATKTAPRSGLWSEIWGANPPQAGDTVLIPEHISVTYDAVSGVPLKAIANKGSFSFSSVKNTKLTVGTILQYKGSFTLKNTNPAIKSEIVFSGTIDSKQDPAEFSLGLVAVGGEVTIEGAPRQSSFGKVSAAAGARALVLKDSFDVRVGDELMIADTQGPIDASYWWFTFGDSKTMRALPQQWELMRVTSVVGNQVFIDKPLQYAHDGYAAVVTRNVEIKSDPAKAVAGIIQPANRGHLIFIGQTKTSIKHIQIKDLGRTTTADVDDTRFGADGSVVHQGKNIRGRYALHFHHNKFPFVVEGAVVTGSSYTKQFDAGTVERAIAGSPRWGIVNHQSFGDIKKSVVIGAAGSGIVGEDGTETGTVDGNLVIGTGRGTGLDDDVRFVAPKGTDFAHGGFGYWFRGPFIEVKNNAAAGYFKQGAYGYFLHPLFSVSKLPNIEGMLAEFKGKDINVNSQGIRFHDNTAEGVFGSAAFISFYSSAINSTNNFKALNNNTAGYGMEIRYNQQFDLNNSELKGVGKAGILTNNETRTLNILNTPVTGFSEIHKKI